MIPIINTQPKGSSARLYRLSDLFHCTLKSESSYDSVANHILM